MSIDRSLKLKNALVRHRNVLTRAERIQILKDEERWTEEQSVLGLPKVAHRKSTAGKKAKAEGAEGVPGAAAAGGPAETAATPAAGAKAAAGTKAAAGGAKAAPGGAKGVK
jgi:small basic protein (TIGR04137 family)